VGRADTIGTVNLARGHHIRQRLHCKRVFVLEPPQSLGRRLLQSESNAKTGDGLPCCRPRHAAVVAIDAPHGAAAMAA
jgi:hypothetical protein